MFQKQKLFSRRNFLLSSGALATTVTLTDAYRFDEPNQVEAQSKPREFPVEGNASLRQRAAAKGLLYGTLANNGGVNNDRFRSLLIQECNLLVCGFFWGGIQPQINTFSFADTDYVAKFASDHKILFRGHPLVYGIGIPKWLSSKVTNPRSTPKEIQNILINHISTIAKRYAGRVHSWDVVNEALSPQSRRSDGVAQTEWINFLGPRYIDLAFRTAAKADPKAILVYNDSQMEYDVPEHEKQRKNMLKFLEGLKSRGVPIHALGIQSHLWSDTSKYFNRNKFRKFLADVASLGLKIMVTELDVSDQTLPADINVRDRIVAGIYEDYLNVVLDERAVIAVITWGLDDHGSWLPTLGTRADKLPMRPLPFDSNYQRKLAWNAIARAFDNAPKR